MTLLKDGDDCQIECDHCTEQTEVYSSDGFYAMVAQAKAEGWEIKRDADGDWSHQCADCRGKSSLARQLDLLS